MAGCGDDDDAAAGFCELLQRSDQVTLASNLGVDQLRETVASGRQTFTDLVAAAPAEVRADVEAVRHGFEEYAAAVESVGFDVAALEGDEAALARSEALYADEVVAAKANLADYAVDECGITLGR